MKNPSCSFFLANFFYIYTLESQDIHLFKKKWIPRLKRQHQYFNRTDHYSSHMDDSPLLYFRMKAMFDSYLPPVVCRRVHVLFTLFIIIRYTHFLPFFKKKRIPHALMVIKRCDLKQEISCSITIVLCKPFFSVVYSIQHYVITFVSDLRRSVVFSG